MSIEWNAEFHGLKEMMRGIDDAEKYIKIAVRKACIDNALHLLSEAVQRAPIYLGKIGPDGNLEKDEDGKIIKDHTGGKLRASGTVLYQEMELAVGDESGSINVKSRLNNNTGRIEHKIEVLVGFNTIYAMKQHEEIGYRHIDGKAKYLEEPLRENADRFTRNMQKEIIKALRKRMAQQG